MDSLYYSHSSTDELVVDAPMQYTNLNFTTVSDYLDSANI